MKTTDIKQKWNQFQAGDGLLQRLDPSHPMDFFIGLSSKGYEEIVLLSRNEPAQLKSSKALEIVKNQRKDGLWATQIASINPSNQDIFAKLCLDLLESSASAVTEQDGLNKIMNRFLAWQRLFENMHTGLPTHVLKGMVGEISFARSVLSLHYDWDTILSGWQGPDGADRDYIFDECWYEVKSVSTGKDKISISSLNQLETDINGYLVKINVDSSSKTDPQAVSVAGVVAAMRKSLADMPSAAMLFEQKLVSLGYVDLPVYEDIFFRISEFDYYLVDDLFPRVTTATVYKEIVAAQYDISLSGIAAWQKKENEIWN